MQTSYQAANRTYQAASAHRSVRDQEADVFRRTVFVLKAAKSGTPIQRVRALADNQRLWVAVTDLLMDPANALPEGLRASIISVGRTVQREMRLAEPDFDFLINVNEQIAEGLAGQITVSG